MNNINLTKIISSISNTPEFLFNNGDSIIKMDTNSYLVNSPSYCQNESGTDIYTYEELLFFIKTHSTIFEDKFDNSAYKKQNYQKQPNQNSPIDKFFENSTKEPEPLTKFDMTCIEIRDRRNELLKELGLI